MPSGKTLATPEEVNVRPPEERTTTSFPLHRSAHADMTSWRLPANSNYRGWRLGVKRIVDIVGAIVALMLLLPVLLIVAVAVKLGSPGPVLFRQSRAGLGGEPFGMYKFRSMFIDAESRLSDDPALFKRYVDNNYKLPESDDPRVTPLGRFLRKSSLDELPQFVNVLLGHMSLVGPRPVVMHELDTHRREDGYVYARPGITGLWQVTARSDVGYPERCAYDNDYLTSWSLLKDITLLVLTIPAVFTGRGAH